jgi:hypothetical protein
LLNPKVVFSLLQDVHMRQWFRPLPVCVALILVPGACALAAPAGSFGGAMAVIVLASSLAFFLSLAAHEAGHLLGGRLAGFRFALYAAGPIRVRRSPSGLRFEVNDRWTLAGFAFSVPVHLRNLKRGMVSFVAGGPVTNLLLAVVVAGLFLALTLAAPSREAVRAFLGSSVSLGLFVFLFQAGFTSLALGVVTLVPLRKDGFFTDGARLLMLLRGGAKAERWSASWALYAASADGQRPRDWDRGLIDQATQLTDGSLDEGGACLLAYLWALDRGDGEAAEGFLDRARDAFDAIPALRPSIAAEIAYFHARFRGDAATARARLDQAQGGFLERHERLRAETAVLLAEHRVAEARERACEALAALPQASVTDAGSAIMHAEWLRDISAPREAGSFQE